MQNAQFDYDFVILGAGVAGLAFAWKMTKEGKNVLILEKESVVGGLSRTLEKNGYLLDFSAHRFHTNNTSLLKDINSLKKLKMYRHTKKSRIFMFHKYLKYPFELPNLLRAMPIKDALFCSFSYIVNLLKNQFSYTTVNSYKEWFINYYGTELYKVMCYPYTAKIWKRDPDTISADWADQRFGGENLSKLLKNTIKKLVSLNFSSYSLDDDSLAPDGGTFYYPKHGIQELPNALANEIKEKKGKIICKAEVKYINRSKHKLGYIHSNKTINIIYKNLITTIPLNILYYLQEKRDSQIEKSFKKNQYMDIIFVYVFLDQPQVSNDHWLYFPDKDIPFNRSVEFKSWSKKMAPKNKTCLCLDITCYFGDTTWNKSDSQIAQECVDAADRIKLFSKINVDGTYTKRIRYAYPVYELNYKERLRKIVAFLQTDNVYLLGRTGIFRYNNSDNSIEMAFQLAENFLKDIPDKSIFEYKIKKVSL